MSADTKIAELLTELHQLIKQTQVSYKRAAIHPSEISPTCMLPSVMCQANQIPMFRRRGRAVNTICSTFRKHMSACRQKTKVSLLSSTPFFFSKHCDRKTCRTLFPVLFTHLSFSISSSLPILPEQAERAVHNSQSRC